MLTFMLITNDPDVARFAAESGVGRLFVDLETLGKQARQGHLDTVMSRHAMADVPRVRAAIDEAGGAELLVRLNPLHAGTAAEVEGALAGGADLLMLPMYREAAEVEALCGLVAGRARVVPLVETPEATAGVAAVAALPGVAELYVGLNDLHLALGQAFMYEPLADGLVDAAAAAIRAAGKPFGFGGIARVGEGQLPGERVLGEHLRLGSTRVILSRTFTGRQATLAGLRAALDLPAELARLRAAERELARRTSEAVEADAAEVRRLVRSIAAARRGARPEPVGP